MLSDTRAPNFTSEAANLAQIFAGGNASPGIWRSLSD